MPSTSDRDQVAPETQVERERERSPWWKIRLPKLGPRTRVGAPTDGDGLTIDNKTAHAWFVAVGYRDLGVVEPFQQRHVELVRTGTLTARQVDAPAGAAYLIAYLGADVHTVQVTRFLVSGQPFYELKPPTGRRNRPAG